MKQDDLQVDTMDNATSEAPIDTPIEANEQPGAAKSTRTRKFLIFGALAIFLVVASIGAVTVFGKMQGAKKVQTIIQPLLDTELMEGNINITSSAPTGMSVTMDVITYSNIPEEIFDLEIDANLGGFINIDGNVKIQDQILYISPSLMNIGQLLGAQPGTSDELSTAYTAYPLDTLTEIETQTPELSEKQKAQFSDIFLKEFKLQPVITKDTVTLTLDKEQIGEFIRTLTQILTENQEEILAISPDFPTDMVPTLKQIPAMLEQNFTTFDMVFSVEKKGEQSFLVITTTAQTLDNSKNVVTVSLNNTKEVNTLKEALPEAIIT